MSKKEPTMLDAMMFAVKIQQTSEDIAEILNKIGVITDADEIEEFVYRIIDRRIEEASKRYEN